MTSKYPYLISMHWYHTSPNHDIIDLWYHRELSTTLYILYDIMGYQGSRWRSTASIVNSRRLVSRKVGCGAAAALAGHAGIAHNHDGLGVRVKVSVGWSDEHRIRAGSANATTRLRATVTAAATVTAWVRVRIRRRLSRASQSRSVDLASWLRDHVHPSYMWPDPLHVASCSRSTETWPWQVQVCISCDFTESFQ